MKPWALRICRMSTATKKDSTLVSMYGLRGCMWCQADSTKLTHWSEEESGGVPSLIGRTAATDAVRVPSGGRNQIGRPTAVCRWCGGRPWWRGGAKFSREGPPFASAPPTPCGTPLEICYWIPGLTCWFQVHRGPLMLLWRMFLTLIQVIGVSPTLWEMPSKISSLVPFSPTSL
jgi:hypothetical protein